MTGTPERTYDDLQAVAHHEAGHVVAARCFRRPVAAVTICSVGQFGGSTALLPGSRDLHILRQNLVILWAGPLASLRYDPEVDPGDRDDQRRLQETAWTLVGRRSERSEVDQEIEIGRRRAERLVEMRWAWIERVAARLLLFNNALEVIRPLDSVNALDTWEREPDASETAQETP